MRNIILEVTFKKIELFGICNIHFFERGKVKKPINKIEIKI